VGRWGPDAHFRSGLSLTKIALGHPGNPQPQWSLKVCGDRTSTSIRAAGARWKGDRVTYESYQGVLRFRRHGTRAAEPLPMPPRILPKQAAFVEARSIKLCHAK
jgi:hypothetical protein